METKTNFQKLEIFYNEYTTKIAELIKSFDGLDMYQQNLLYNNLLHYGLLSMTSTFEFHNYSIDNDENSVLGARITSGNGVCRHMATNQIDVFEKLGYQTVDITCFAKYPNLLKKHPNIYLLSQILNFTRFPCELHAITGIYNNKEHLVVCPTTSLIGVQNTKKNIYLVSPIEPNERKAEFIISSLGNTFEHPYEHKKFLKLLCLPNYIETKSLEELKEIYTYSEILFSTNYGQLKDWQSENLDLMNEICFLDKKLSRYSDQITRSLNR